ncbi:MAG: AAA family ATPase, partial [Salinisphaera sp.]|nr:AAA family ATPase [Salinisphaera sp.]
MVPRSAQAEIRQLAAGYPVIVVVGPRQSGKTTLCRAIFANHSYVSLEDPDVLRFATQDPR